MTNLECIQEVQGKLAVMAKLVRIYEDGLLDVEGEEVALSQQNKAQIKQKLTQAKVACITTLNQIQVN